MQRSWRSIELAWFTIRRYGMRTSTSLISFGFTIYKFFQYLRENEQGAANEVSIGPRGFARWA